jgi:hypothetical protein
MDKLHQARNSTVNMATPNYGCTSIQFSKRNLKEIKDALGDLLFEDGITDGEVNAKGRYLETLLDTVLSDLD